MKIFIKYKTYFFAIIIFIIPFFNYLDNGAFDLSGDSTRAYLIYPLKWINQYSLNLISNGFSGSPFSTNYIITPQLFIYYLLNKLTFNNFIYFHNSLIAFFAFIGFYKLLKFFLKKNYSYYNKDICLIISIFYAYCPLYQSIIFDNGGFWIYVYSGVPILFYFFFLFIYSGQKKHLLAFIFFLFLFSSIFLYQNLSWSLSIIISIISLFLFTNFEELEKRNFHNLLVIISIILLFNLPNLFSFFHEFLNRDLLESSVRGIGGKKIFETLSNNVENNFFPLYFTPNLKILSFGMDSYFINNKFFLKLLILSNSLFLLFILHTITELKYKNIKILTVISIIFIINYLFLNMSFNTFTNLIFSNLFKIDYLVIFRSYYSKFYFGFIFSYLILITIILKKINIDLKNIKTLCLLIIFLFINFFNILNGTIYNNKARFLNDYTTIDGISDSFYEAINKINDINSQNQIIKNIVSLPISNEYEILINKNKIYLGPSIVPLLTKSKIYQGYYLTGNKDLFENLINKNIKFIKDFLSEKNINTFILNKILFEKKNVFANYLNEKNEINFYKNIILNDLNYDLIFENEEFLIYSKNKSVCLETKLISPTKIIFKPLCNNKYKNFEDFEILLKYYSMKLNEVNIYNTQNSSINLSFINFFKKSIKVTDFVDSSGDSYIINYKKQQMFELIILFSILSIFLLLLCKFQKK